ncbi:uncharacterized protein LOC126905281 isoform X2 [Daktulosphaira vitifoliae]|uniref:uncharacterized protein LOC126905281 isoform X2 n=1 Tax=Daktulosphaira vitifoliae TaxID=58002 RepID=UPI0021AABC63|nr:uncharacterized protein LOC126905281 isoform X2 [Daktulosphaira vitifoliae]
MDTYTLLSAQKTGRNILFKLLNYVVFVRNMNIEERRNERRRKILENSEARLSRINALKTAKIDLNIQNDLIGVKKEKSEYDFKPDYLLNEKCTSLENSKKVDKNDKLKVKNFDFNYCEPNLKRTLSNYYQIDVSRTTIVHILLSQLTLALLYYDFGFLFANSAVMPFIISIIPEFIIVNEEHDGLHIFGLLMIGFSQKIAKLISVCLKLSSIIGKQFSVYIFLFTCSYVIINY